MLLGNVPGMLAGLMILELVDGDIIRRGVGALIVIAPVLLMSVRGVPRFQRGRVAAAVGFAGGAVGTTSSLNGIPPTILYAYERSAPRRMVADLSGYFVISNLTVAAVLWVRGIGDADGLGSALIV